MAHWQRLAFFVQLAGGHGADAVVFVRRQNILFGHFLQGTKFGSFGLFDFRLKFASDRVGNALGFNQRLSFGSEFVGMNTGGELFFKAGEVAQVGYGVGKGVFNQTDFGIVFAVADFAVAG